MSALSPQIQRCYDLALRGAWQHPFFLIPLGHCEWHEGDPKVTKTMEIAPIVRNGKPEVHMWINPEWVAGIRDDEIFGCLCHEIMHCMLRHHERGGGKQADEWAQAADMVINYNLKQAGIKLPDGVLYPPPGSEEAPAEELYDLLVAKKIQKPKNYQPDQVGKGCMPKPSADGSEPGQSPAPGNQEGQGSGEDEGEGDGQGQGSSGGEGQEDGTGQTSGAGATDANRAWGEMLAQSQSYARGTGAAKVFAKIFAPKPTKTKWSRLMKQTANRAQAKGGRDTQTFSKTHRRSGGSDFIMPGWQSTSPAISVIIDTSGSVSDEMLRSSISAVIEIAKSTSMRIFLALHDGECYYSGWIKPETTVESLSKLCGQRGGTCPEGAFDAVGAARARFDVCVYLTDGEVGIYPQKPQNVKRMIVGIVGDSRHRSQVHDGWQEILVEI